MCVDPLGNLLREILMSPLQVMDFNFNLILSLTVFKYNTVKDRERTHLTNILFLR